VQLIYGMSCWVPFTVVIVKVVGQRASGIERLHRRIGVVERIGPDTNSDSR